MTPVIHLTRRTYIDVEALRHYLNPLCKSTPECLAAKSAYQSIRKKSGDMPEPCPICSAVEAAIGVTK